MAVTLDDICDWLESVALARGLQAVGIQFAESLGAGHFDLDPEHVAQAYRRAGNRKKSLGQAYPFKVDSDFIVSEPGALRTAYAQSLIVSGTAPHRNLESWDLHAASKAFEVTVEAAVGNFFGAQTRTVNFGFPSQVGRPREFPAAVAWLAELMRVRLGSSYRPPRKKDGGVDVFVWKDLDDLHGGLPVLLLQTTIMQDFLNKIADIDLRVWSGWLAADTDPLIGLAVPTLVSDKNVWSEISARGILLDRVRLSKLASGVEMPLAPIFYSLNDALAESFE